MHSTVLSLHLALHAFIFMVSWKADMDKAHAGACSVNGDTVCVNKNPLLTQHWAGQQRLSSMKCQTFQSVVVVDSVHPLLFPNKDNVEMSAVRASQMPLHNLQSLLIFEWSYSS